MSKATKTVLIVLGIVLVLCASVGIGAAIVGSGDTPSSSATIGSAGDEGVGEAPKVVEAKGSISDGTWRVNDEVKAGTYTATVPDGGLCYYARLRGFSGDIGDLITNDVGNPGDRVRVTIKKTDAGFETHDCGEWKRS